MMWSACSDELTEAHGLRFSILFETRPATFTDVIRAWETDEGFQSKFNALLAAVPYSAFRWETPPVTLGTASQPFEFVVLDSPGLARSPDPEAFAEHFLHAKTSVVAFPNLNGDATLVVPCAMTEPSVYGHLAAFVRYAPESQQRALWEAVGRAMAERVGTNPVWLSTAGAGVSWLHVRLDDRPKYYGYGPYRQRRAEPGAAQSRGA